MVPLAIFHLLPLELNKGSKEITMVETLIAFRLGKRLRHGLVIFRVVHVAGIGSKFGCTQVHLPVTELLVDVRDVIDGMVMVE